MVANVFKVLCFLAVAILSIHAKGLRDNVMEVDSIRDLQSTTVGNAGSSLIRQLMRSLKTGSTTAFPSTAQVDPAVKLRVVPVGDFSGYNQFKAATWNPFRDSASFFSSVNQVFEIYNVNSGTQTDGRVLFLYDISVTVSTRINTLGPRARNVTIQGTAKITGGRISHAYFNMLNLDELIFPNYGTYSTTSQNYINFICDNEANRCPSSIFNSNNIWWTKGACVTDQSLYLKDIGKWTGIGREDSYLCRAWYSTMVAGDNSLCQSLRTLVNSRCKRTLYDQQWSNVADFYGMAPAAIPKVREHSLFPPFTLSTSTATTCDAACRARNVQTIELLYSNMLWPQAFIVGRHPEAFDQLFSDDVRGRITPVGNFEGKELGREYFSGLTSSNYSSASNAFILMNEATENFLVIAHYVVQLDAQPATDFTPIAMSATNMSEVIIFQFDKQGRIIAYDGDLSELGAAQDPDSILKRSPLFKDRALLADISADIAGSLNLLSGQTIDGICQAATGFCNAQNDPNGFYSSNAACKTYLSNLKYGSWHDVTDHNTVTCRLLHTLLVPLRPDIHCPHIGRSGGGKCVTKTMADWYGWVFRAATPQVVASTADEEVVGTVDDSSSSSSNTALIVGLSVGLGLTALLVAGVIGYKYKKNASSNQAAQTTAKPQRAGEPDIEVTGAGQEQVPAGEGRLSVSDGMRIGRSTDLGQI